MLTSSTLPSATASISPSIAPSSSSSTNTGAIVGGVIGGVAGLVIIGAAVFFLVRRRKKAPADQEVFRPDDVDDDYNPTGTYSSQPLYRNSDSSSAPMTEQAPAPPRHSFYDPKNKPVSY